MEGDSICWRCTKNTYCDCVDKFILIDCGSFCSDTGKKIE